MKKIKKGLILALKKEIFSVVILFEEYYSGKTGMGSFSALTLQCLSW